MKKKLMATVLAASLAFGLAACGSAAGGDTASEAPSEESAEEAPAEEAPAAEDTAETAAEAGKTLKIAYIPNSMSNEMNAYGYKIMEEHQGDYNMEVTAFDGQYDSQTETAAITNCIGQGYDAMILCPSDINAVIPAVMQAKEAGIIVAMYSADLPEEYREYRDIFVGVDDTEAGKNAAKAFIDRFPDGAKVIEVGGTAGTDAQIRRHDGFNAGLEGSKIEVLDYQATESWSSNETMDITQDMIVKYGDEIQGIFCHWDGGATGCIEALKNAGIEGTYIVAIDGSRSGFDQVKDGTQNVCISQNVVNISLKALEVIRSAADGGDFEAENYVPLDMVTSDNVEELPYPEW